MSRLAKQPISLPKGVELKASKEGLIQCKGPKGTLQLQLPIGLAVRMEEQDVFLERAPDLEYPLLGLYRSLVKNLVIGVSEGFEVQLVMVGVGYRASVQGTQLDLQVGNSHPTLVPIPPSVQVVIEDKGASITIKGCDQQVVTQFAATVRAKRPPEPYKGKGIRYKDERVRKKEGKAAKGKAG